MGTLGIFSEIGISGGSPYTAQVDERMKYGVPASKTASNTDSPHFRLFSKYLRGSLMDSVTREEAAKCITASVPRKARLSFS